MVDTWLIWLLIFMALGLLAVLRPLSTFMLLAYNGNLSNANSIDLTANTDANVSTRNGHYLLSEQYNLIAATAVGNTITEANLLSPTLNAYGKFNINPVNVTTTQLSPPRIDWYTRYPIPLPENEEIQFQLNASGTDTVGGIGLLFLGAPGWKRGSYPQGVGSLPMFKIRFTCTPTLNSRNWSTLVNMTFEQSLRGGTYAVIGLELQGTNLIAGRIVFPSPPVNTLSGASRVMRPGALASNVFGDVGVLAGDIGPNWSGFMGLFNTSELPLFEALGEGSATTAVQGWLTLVVVSMPGLNINYGAMP